MHSPRFQDFPRFVQTTLAATNNSDLFWPVRSGKVYMFCQVKAWSLSWLLHGETQRACGPFWHDSDIPSYRIGVYGDMDPDEVLPVSSFGYVSKLNHQDIDRRFSPRFHLPDPPLWLQT